VLQEDWRERRTFGVFFKGAKKKGVAVAGRDGGGGGGEREHAIMRLTEVCGLSTWSGRTLRRADRNKSDTLRFSKRKYGRGKKGGKTKGGGESI